MMATRRDGARRQAAPDPRRRDPRVRARGLPPLPRVGRRATRRASPTASSTTTSARRRRSSTRSSSSAGSCMLDAIAEIDARDVPVAREAALDRRLHHRLVPPRPRPDEGDHRRGHARRELVRRAPPRRDPRGLRGHRRDRRDGPRGRARSSPTSPPSSRPCASTARSSSCSPAGSSRCCRGPTRSSSAPRTSWSRRSAAAWRIGAAECSARVWLNPAPMDNDIVKRLMWSGLLAGVGALTTIVANRIATEIWLRVFKEDPPTD